MLQKKVYENPTHRLLDRFPAECPETGATINRTNGRSKAGLAPKWLVKFKPLGMWYGFTVRGWTLEEAIEAANKKLMKQYAKAIKEKRLDDWYEFMDIDQQAFIPVSDHGWLSYAQPDKYARLWVQPTHPTDAVDASPEAV
jgi:hypothetical protein